MKDVYDVIEGPLKPAIRVLTWIAAACVIIFIIISSLYGKDAEGILKTTQDKIYLVGLVSVSIFISSVIICAIIVILSNFLFEKRINGLDGITNTLSKSEEKLSKVALRMEKAGEALLDNTWFLSSEEFENREREIISEKDSITVYVVSDTLSFDVDTDLIGVVKENIKNGINYRYIIKFGLEMEKDIIRKNAGDAKLEFSSENKRSKCGDVKFFEVKEAHLILAFDYAIFAFKDKNERNHLPKTEVYVALESGADPHHAPWMRLDGNSRKMVVKYVNSIKPEAWMD